MAADWLIFVSHHFDFGVNLKPSFPKEFLNEIWLIIEDHEYFNIAEMKIWHFYSGRIFGPNIFPTPLPANLC